MNLIIKGLWLGGKDDANNANLLQSKNINAVLNVAREVAPP